jgi:hypothetical protein
MGELYGGSGERRVARNDGAGVGIINCIVGVCRWAIVAGLAMGCLKGTRIRKAKSGDFRCKDCGVVAAKKKNLCAPKKVKK